MKYTRQESSACDIARQNEGIAGKVEKKSADSPQNDRERAILRAFRNLTEEAQDELLKQIIASPKR